MNRRDAIVAMASLGAMAAPLRAQPALARVGYLGPSADTAPKLLAAFQEGLAAQGYTEGRNITVEYRWTNSGSRMNDAAALLASARGLVDRPVRVLVASIDPAIAAARKATATLPIVMLNSSDPVGLGFVATLARPGGNVTGLTNQSQELIGKKLQVLLEIVPSATRIGMLASGPGALRDETVARARELARSRGVTLLVADAATAAALESAFAEFKRGGAQAVLAADTGGGVFFTERKRLAELALAGRLPSMFANVETVESGGLMSYSPSSVENYRRGAVYVGRILRGAKPGDLPVEQPTKFELALNLKTAAALGLAVAPSLLVRVDHLVQ